MRGGRVILPEFDTALSQFLMPKPQKIAVATSGGADSFALLHLAQKWARQHNIKLLALTVDHQLRAESAAEAQQVAQWCQQYQIEYNILTWQDDKPHSALQAVARKARRRLLCEACVEHQVDALLLGHQADDQAETMMMRLQRGSGLTGLRVMQPVTRDKATKMKLIRPLLLVTRAALRQYCLDRQLPFTDDPSNDDPRFERVQARRLLAQWPQLIPGVAIAATRLKRADDALQKLAQEWLDQHITSHDENPWLPEHFTALLPELQIRVLGILLNSRSLTQIEQLALAMAQADFAGLTLAARWVRPKSLHGKKGFLFQPAPPRKPSAQS